MKRNGHRPGTTTRFIDTLHEEAVLQILVDQVGRSLFAFKLYDARGDVVMASPDPQTFADGLVVRCSQDELLLEVPPDGDGDIMYRLYNRLGELLTASDGKRTQIYGHLRIDGKASPAWTQKASPTTSGS